MPLEVGLGLFTGQVPPGAARKLQEEYRDILRLSQLAERSGFDSVWVSEHHGAADSYLPSLTVMLAAIAAVTQRVGLGMGVALAPFQHPLRFAEDCAVVDQLSGGRLVVGLGYGWREEEFRAFGVPIAERLRRTIELLRVCRLAWGEERFSFEGRHFHYDRVAVTPKPAHDLHVLMGGLVEKAAVRAGRLADGYLASRTHLDRFKQLLASFDEGARAAGKDPRAMLAGFLHNAWVSPDGGAPEYVYEGAWHQLGTYAAWVDTDTPDARYRLGPLDRRLVEERTAVGTPQQLTARFAEWVEASRDRRLIAIFRLHYPGMTYEQAAPAVELFGREVIPALKQR